MSSKLLSVFLSLIASLIVLHARQHPASVTAAVASDSTIMATKYAHAVDLFYEHDDTGEALMEAKNEFAAILTLDPHHAASLAYLGLIALETKNLSSADSLFTLALADDSTCPEAHIGKAQWFREQRQWQAGYNEARLAVKLAPKSAIARWELVDELLHRAEAPVTDSIINEAIPHLLKLLEFNPGDRQAHHDLARSYEQLKRWQEASTQYQEVLRIGQLPEDMDVWVYTVHLDAARCFEHLGNYNNAIEEMKLYLTSIKELGSGEEEIKKIQEQIRQLEQKNH